VARAHFNRLEDVLVLVFPAIAAAITLTQAAIVSWIALAEPTHARSSLATIRNHRTVVAFKSNVADARSILRARTLSSAAIRT
jgi:hypothetical protein